MNIKSLWKDFQYIRKHCNQPIKNIEYTTGWTKWSDPDCTAKYIRVAIGMPRWLLWLAEKTSKKSATTIQTNATSPKQQ